MKHHHTSKQNVSRETYEEACHLYQEHSAALNTYLDRLFWWNERINLVSRNVSRETIREHLIHSIALSFLEVFRESKIIVDAGTGGGLPGLPLAILHPEKQLVLNDIVSKKCLAVKQMARKLGLKNTRIASSSVEKLEINGTFLLISKHAFKINSLFKLTSHLPWKKMVLYKGNDFQGEFGGISIPLSITCFDLSDWGKFYNGKSIIVIDRS